MRRLSRALSRPGESKEKEALAEAASSIPNDPSPPPAYHEHIRDDPNQASGPSDLTAGFSNLQLDPLSPDTYREPRPQECIAHLKLLECFHRLKQSIAKSDGLFGISLDMATELKRMEQPLATSIEDSNNEISALLAEKRWQVYVTRAVSRFSSWRNSLEPEYNYYTIDQALTRNGGELAGRVESGHTKPFDFTVNNLPPVDVLMVWHSYMLNPRAYLEDCAREGRMRLWHTPMPWLAVMDAIDNESFDCPGTKAARDNFEYEVHRNWNNLDDSKEASFECPHCHATNEVSWTTCGELTTAAREAAYGATSAQLLEAVRIQVSSCDGMADKGFVENCFKCGKSITHDTLCAGKLRKDLERLVGEDVMMPGTIYGRSDVPERVGKCHDTSAQYLYSFPSKLMKAGLAKQILVFNKDSDMGMSTIRESIEEGMTSKDFVRPARNSLSTRVLRDEAVAVRRMMSRYWQNPSPFALDLVSAVTRQGSFIEKMHNIDWLHSPALPNTMARLLVKYVRFMGIIAKHHKMAVPTLDVDLAWHTHQLNPLSYIQYTVAKTRTFVDHDDKVAETKLTDSFAWTSKIYQKLYGEPYSECTCWYCEAVRESHTSTASRLFRSSNATAADELHFVESDPKKSVHISSHNAVNPVGDASYDLEVTKHASELEHHYQKACQRAEKKGRPKPKRDDYYYSDAWGYPVYMPAYAPFVGAYAFTPVIYPVNPGCMAVAAGAAGNCCAGTCGGGIAAGASCAGAGMGGGCASAVGGASCGGGGGGGGGGCGGGGGGCGGGGGGCGGGGC